MDEILKMIFKDAEKHGMKVHVIKEDDSEKEMNRKPVDEYKEAIDEAAKIAKLNRILYEAHIKYGFTSEQALAMTIATLNN